MMTGDPESQPTRAQLAEEIAPAFGDAEPPDPPLTIGEGPIQDDVERALAGKRGDELTPEDALEVRLDLWSLTPAAFKYYVPALLRMYLVGDGEVDGLDEGVFGVLVPPDNDELRKRFESRMQLLDEREREALGSFVCWYRAQEPEIDGADKAAEYWHCA